MSEKVYLAVDLGASSGRVVAGRFTGEQLSLEEIHRFGNGPVTFAGTMHWDVLRLWSDIQDGLRAARGRYGSQIVSLGLDTWGVDYALLDADDQLVGNPTHYRDSRTNGMFDVAFGLVSREEIFAATGLQFMEINTLYQLLSMQRAGSRQLADAKTFLMMPDLFHWLLTGEKGNEFTDATTTQFFNPSTRSWATGLLDKLQIPTDMFQTIIQPGTDLGTLRSEVARDTGLADARVVVPGTHDTASAVMAVPTASSPSDQPDWCYISSGTWSLMGVEVPSPILTDTCREMNFTNEGGVGDTIRVLKNISGLWLIQECRRTWQQAGNDLDWGQMVSLAADAPALTALINPHDARFVAPDSMPASIAEFCQQTGQNVPQSEGQIVRCALESLALCYRQVLAMLEELTGGQIATIHIVGGGTQNELLCQMAANACGRHVVAGPIEATAIGNIMMQAVAHGDVASITQARDVIRNSFPVKEYSPQNVDAWSEAFARFEAL